MASARYAWGIDIGNRALKAVRLAFDGAQYRIDDFEVIEHENVLSNAGDNKDQLIQHALTSFVQRHGTKGAPVAISVSGQSSLSRFVKLPPVEPSKIPEIVKFEAIQQIPFDLSEVEWAYQLFEDPASPDVEVGIFAMRKELVNRQIQFFSDVDMDVQVVQLNPLAVYNAMFFDQKIDGVTMIIDLGAENTDLIIAEGESVWLRSIPIGGNNFTEALVKSFKLNFQKAEDLKRTAATSKYARQIFQAMRPIFADLVAEVQRSIGFYASVHREARIKKIIALGGTFRLPGLQKYLQQNLQLDVERIDSLGSGAPPDAKMATLFGENILSSVSAYGLALQALGEGKINSSLLPMEIRRERLWRDKTKWFAAAAALFCVGTGIGFGSYYQAKVSFDGKQAERNAIQQIQGQAAGLSQRWGDIEQRGSSDRTLIANVKSLEQYRDLWANILVDIHKALPLPQWAADATPEQIKAIPRGDRTAIVFERMTSKYVTDISAEMTRAVDLTNPGGGGPGPGMMPPGGFMPGGMPSPGAPAGAPDASGAPAGPALVGTRGFVITIEGTTTQKDGPDFVDRALVQNLMRINPQGDTARPYRVVKATTVVIQRFKVNRQTKLVQAYTEAIKTSDGAAPTIPGGGAMRMPGGNRPAPLPNNPGGGDGVRSEESAFLDPLTGENMLDDWEFTVQVLVAVEPGVTTGGDVPQ